MLQKKQGTYCLLGNGDTQMDPEYVFNDAILPVGAGLLGRANRPVSSMTEKSVARPLDVPVRLLRLRLQVDRLRQMLVQYLDHGLPGRRRKIVTSLKQFVPLYSLCRDAELFAVAN